MSHPLRPRIGTTPWTALAVSVALAAAPTLTRAGLVGPAPAGETIRRDSQPAPAALAAPAAADWSGWDFSQPFSWNVTDAPNLGTDEVRGPASVERLRLPQLTEAETAAAAAIVEAEATGAWGGLPAPAVYRPPVAFMPQDDDGRAPAIPLPPGAWTGLSVLAGIGALTATRGRRWLC